MENEIMSVDMVVRLLLPNKSDIPYRGLLKHLMCKTPELTAYKESKKTIPITDYNSSMFFR